jgi:hypothetical protein
MINILQEPYGLQAVNSDHIWTIYDDEYTGYTNYKYVIDFYIDPYEEGHEKVGRIKLRPNSYGRASFNARDIIKNYIAPNPRTSPSGVSALLDYQEIVNKTGFTFTNYLNDDDNYEKLRQVANYRILIGKEYTSGGTTTISIPTDYYTPTYTISWSVPPGTNNIVISNANGWEDLVSSWALANQTWDSGFTWTHTNSVGGFIDGGSNTSDGFTYVPTITPSPGDIFWVVSSQNKCGYWFEYQYEGISWDFRGSYSRDYTFDGCYEDHSAFKTIWLGTAPNLVMDIDQLSASSNSNNDVNSRWGYLYQLGNVSNAPYLIPSEPGYENQPWRIMKGSFLNTYGTDYKHFEISTASGAYQTEPYLFYRQHHRECPIILNWFSGVNGLYQNTYDFLFEGTGGTNNVLTFTTQLTPLSDGSGRFTPANELIQSYIKKDLPDVDKMVFMISNSPGVDSQYVWEDGRSMGMVYELYDNSCNDDPVHFLFINRHGAFDTYTFGQKNIRSHSTSISTYAKSGIRDTSSQRWGSDMYRNTPYDQTTITSVETQSNFVNENDVPIIQDLFMSPYVWRIQDLEDRKYLVPIQITSNSVEEYKSRYNKLYQYDMTFRYNPIRQFNNPL